MKTKSHRIDLNLTTLMFLKPKNYKQDHSNLTTLAIIAFHCFWFNVHIPYPHTQNSDLRSL
jgi:hypothetical protein